MDNLEHRSSFDEMLLDARKQERIIEIERRLANCAWLITNSRRILDQRPNSVRA